MANRLARALIDRLLRSDEFFTETAYRVVLGRPADPQGLVNYRDALGHGRPRIEVLNDFFNSAEFREKLSRSRTTYDLRHYDVRGVPLALYDVAGYPMRDIVVGELLADSYGIDAIPLADGDHVIDIGANFGAVAIYIARRYPGVTVHAFEPVPATFDLLLRNIEVNNCSNICAWPKAVTGDGRPITLAARAYFLGGATAHCDPQRVGGPDHEHFTVESTTLNDIFTAAGIGRCALLKIDCEGGEYEILLGAQCLARVDYLSAEFHTNTRLRAAGYSPDALARHCHQFIPAERVRYVTVEMAD